MANKTIHQLTPIESLDLSSTVEFAVYDAGNNSTNKLDLLNINLPQLGTNNKTIPSAINELKSNNDQLQESITEITDGIGNIGQFGDRITSLEESVGDIQNNINGLNTVIGDVPSGSTVMEQINDLNTVIGEVPSGSSAMGQISSCKSSISSNTTKINNLISSTAGLDTKITTVTNELTIQSYSYSDEHGFNVVAKKFGKTVIVDINVNGLLHDMPTQENGTGSKNLLIATLPQNMKPKNSSEVFRTILTTKKYGTITIDTEGKVYVGFTYRYVQDLNSTSIEVTSSNLGDDDGNIYSKVFYIINDNNN